MHQYVTTYTGKRFFPFEPDADLICAEDIAHQLGALCRYAGATEKHYSVAEHCVLLSRAVPPGLALAALLHDAAEIYVVDMPSPVKYHEDMIFYRDTEDSISHVIREKFHVHLTPDQEHELHVADRGMVGIEKPQVLSNGLHDDLPFVPDYMRDVKVQFWDRVRAKEEFLNRLYELTGV